MADTNHAPSIPTEGDGISYRGIVWFIVILVVTVVASQALMWGMFKFMDARAVKNDTARPPLSAPMGEPLVDNGRIVPATPIPSPTLLMSEPTNLQLFRQKEEDTLTTYGWVDKNAGTVRIPIDRAKDLILQRGIPGGVPMAPAVPVAPGKSGG